MSAIAKQELFTLEKNVPIPEIVGMGRPSPMKAALLRAQVGDSFLIPEKRMNGLWKMVRDMKLKVCTRKQADGLRRVWRVK